MNKKQLFCMWLGIVIFIFLGLGFVADGYFDFSPLGRLAILWICTAVITAGLIYTFKGREPKVKINTQCEVMTENGIDFGGTQKRGDGESRTIGLYAGFRKRFAAFIIDGIIVILGGSIALPIITIIIFIFTGGYVGADSWMDTWHVYASVTYPITAPIIVLLYYAIMESSHFQSTVGKMVFKIIVTDLYGNRISFGRAIIRNLCKYISGFIFGIGYLVIPFTIMKQGLHDMMTGCLVMNR